MDTNFFEEQRQLLLKYVSLAGQDNVWKHILSNVDFSKMNKPAETLQYINLGVLASRTIKQRTLLEGFIQDTVINLLKTASKDS